jgi:hypothetical protein
MKSIVKRVTMGTALGGALFFSAGVGVANAAPNDGQVDLALGNVGILEDVPFADAAQIAAGVCDVEVGRVNSLARSTDVFGDQLNVCTNNLGAIDLRQNEPGVAVGAAEQQQDATAEPGAETPGAAEEPGAAEQPGAAEEPGAAEQPGAAEEAGAAEQPVAAEEPLAAEEPVAAEEPLAAEEPVAAGETEATPVQPEAPGAQTR